MGAIQAQIMENYLKTEVQRMNINKDAADGISSTPAARNDNRHYRAKKTNVQGRFDRTKLPYPIEVLYLLGIKAGTTNVAGYWKISCPFHNNGAEKNPSLNLHQVNGNFKCHACNAKGGDILSFYMQVTGMKFVEAAKKLGAWGYVI